jgi:hypothetical protein
MYHHLKIMLIIASYAKWFDMYIFKIKFKIFLIQF